MHPTTSATFPLCRVDRLPPEVQTGAGRGRGRVNDNLFGQLHGAAKVASTGSATIFGVEIALVTNVQDPQKLGRVKVCYPRLSGMPESEWARVVQPAGGPGRG